jgi:nitroreductase
MEKRGWKLISSDMSILMFGIQDASYMAQNIVIAAESLGLGTCYLGFVPFQAPNLIKRFKLPPRVFPLVGLAVGFPAEDPPVRPRYPLEFALYDGQYPGFNEEQIEQAMQTMDEGYLQQDYYKKPKIMIKLEAKNETYTYENYSWTEHISRKWGQWLDDPEEIMSVFRKCGFFKEK